jgi:malonyl-CoA/methylmalonyl-CoA synthetase
MGAGTGFPLDRPEVHPDTLASWSLHMGVSSLDAVDVRQRLGKGTLPAAFADTARRRAGSPALSIGGRSMTHGEMDASAARAAAGFDRLGAGPGRAVMLVAETAMPHVIAYLGVLRVGAGVVLANPTLTPAELSRMAADSDASLVVGSGPGLEACLRAGLSTVAEIVGLAGDDRKTATVLLDDLADEEVPVRPIDPESPAILAFTSGTTGRPKCAPLSHRNLLASIRGVMWAWRWSQNDHLVHTLPISHQHGLGGIHATLLGGSRATLLGHFDAEAVLETVTGEEASVLFAVPTVHERLLTELGGRAAGLRRLRLVTSGSAPLPVDLARRLENAIGQIPVERYGSTESGLDVSNPYYGPRVPGSVGLSLPGVEIAIVDDSDDLVPPGMAGEVVIRGPQVFAGYLGREPDDETFLRDWFRTGDIGVRDEESGYLRLVGRSKDVIITGGMNVYPREVEDALRTVPGLSDIVVVGIPSRRWGEEVVVFVSPARVLPERVAELASRDLAPYKRPKRIYTLAEIPRSPMGKVLSQELVDLALSTDGWTSPPGGI